MAISKKFILNIVLVIWIVFSVGYILYDIWSDFRFKALNEAYQQGRIDTINSLVQQAEKCEAIPIFSGEKSVKVINVDCLRTLPEE